MILTGGETKCKTFMKLCKNYKTKSIKTTKNQLKSINEGYKYIFYKMIHLGGRGGEKIQDFFLI